MRLKKIISLSLALLTGISVLPMQLFAASSGGWEKTEWPGDPGTSSVISQGDIYYLEKRGSSVYPEKYKFKADGSDGDGIPTNSQLVMQNGKKGPIVPPWKQFYDGLTDREKKEYILVRDKITITKKDKSGKPLKGIVFQIDKKDVCTTNQDGKCTITFADNKWGPIDLIEIIEKDTNNRPKYKNKTIKLYRDPGTRFLGEVSGNDLGITYKSLRDKVGKGTIPSIKRSQSEIIYDQNEKEEKVGGIWLKFIDRDQFGKIHVFYVAKRPILKNISWNDIHSAGMVYGWDVISPNTGLPKSNPEKYKNIGQNGTNKDYKATIIQNQKDNNKYIVRLLQGKSNYGDDVSNLKIYSVGNGNLSSEWDRTILPITKSYRLCRDINKDNYMERVLNEKDGDDYNIQTAQYNWFGDLTLGSYIKFIYHGNTIDNNNDGTGQNGQLSWTQEYVSPNNRLSRGRYSTYNGAVYSEGSNPGYRGIGYGFRPVLEVAPKEYDGVVFEGEVTGNELGITYNNLILNKDKTKRFPNAEIPGVSISYKQNADQIINQNLYELANGGIWLKFTDYKYKRKNTETDIEEPRTFYVAKKPILKNISWNDIHTAGMVYGWDVIDPHTGSPKLNPKNYTNNDNPYKAHIKKVNGKEYIVRLLQGQTNYGGDVTKNKIYREGNNNNNSEWNRVMLSLVQGYRFGSRTDNRKYAENILRQSDRNSNYFTRKYTNNTAQYNWFGDLTLGAVEKFQYNDKTIDNNNNGTGANGQWNWTQECSYSSSEYSGRGGTIIADSAAWSSSSYADDKLGIRGFRPVLEPLNN